MDKLPNTEEMLRDLAAVKGLDFFWQTLAMAMSVGPELMTEEEREVVEANAPIPYRITEAGRKALEGK